MDTLDTIAQWGFGAPWTVRGLADDGATVTDPQPQGDGWPFVVVARTGMHAACGIQDRAVADLVAAAPELLAALEQIASFGENDRNMPTTPVGMGTALDALRGIARAAVAKVEGRRHPPPG